jgi:hypothetical protein
MDSFPGVECSVAYYYVDVQNYLFSDLINFIKNLSLKKSLLFTISLLMIITSSCSVLQQASEVSAFSKCEFRLESLTNLKIAGVNIQDKTSLSQVGLIDAAKITGAIASGSLPMTFDLNLQVKNPNPAVAAMNKLDWILLIDGNEMSRGILNQRVEIQPNSVKAFAVGVNFDLFKALNGQSSSALLNFAFNLAGAGSKTTRVTLKVRPTIMIGTTPVEYPGYISINHEFGAK